MKDKKLLGALGENMAEAILYAEGKRILERNYKVKPGELDIICDDEKVIWFVEVKTRTGKSFGEPIEAVDMRKRMRMRRAAEYYLMNKRINKNVCFKVMEILVRETDDDLSMF